MLSTPSLLESWTLQVHFGGVFKESGFSFLPHGMEMLPCWFLSPFESELVCVLHQPANRPCQSGASEIWQFLCYSPSRIVTVEEDRVPSDLHGARKPTAWSRNPNWPIWTQLSWTPVQLSCHLSVARWPQLAHHGKDCYMLESKIGETIQYCFKPLSLRNDILFIPWNFPAFMQWTWVISLYHCLTVAPPMSLAWLPTWCPLCYCYEQYGIQFVFPLLS